MKGGSAGSFARPGGALKNVVRDDLFSPRKVASHETNTKTPKKKNSREAFISEASSPMVGRKKKHTHTHAHAHAHTHDGRHAMQRNC